MDEEEDRDKRPVQRAEERMRTKAGDQTDEKKG